MLSTRYVPHGFKFSYIVPIPKPKDYYSKPLKCDDFRGIAISPILSKVFEYCLLDKFNHFLKTSDKPFGFKKGLGCNHAIYSAHTIVGSFVRNGSTVNLCAIDLSKAFYKVNLHTLFIKLMKRNVPVQLLGLLENMLFDCYIALSNGRTSIQISSQLCLVYVRAQFQHHFCSLSSLMNSNTCNLECNRFFVVYADDILLISPSVVNLENLIHLCERELNWLDMAINYKKSCCLRIGPRCDVSCANITSLNGHVLPWTNVIRYLGTFIVQSRAFKCSIDEAKRSFYRAANAIFGKIGRLASEKVTLYMIHLLKTKCIPVLLYGLEVLQLNKSQISSTDFVINRFFMKLFNTNNIEIVKCCQQEFCFSLPSITLARPTDFFKAKLGSVRIFLSKGSSCVCNFVTLPAIDVFILS